MPVADTPTVVYGATVINSVAYINRMKWHERTSDLLACGGTACRALTRVYTMNVLLHQLMVILMLIAIIGGSEVIWDTVFAICPFNVLLFFELTIYIP